MSAVRIALVAAVARNGVIGDGKTMPWRLSTDMKRFVRLTMGKPVVVGRKTFETFAKPLAGRTNIVVSRLGGTWPEGVLAARDVEVALALGESVAQSAGGDEVMVIGGGEIYAETIGRADRLYITHVEVSPEGRTRFPKIDQSVWRALSSEPVPAGEKDSAATTFVVYDRIAG